MRKTLVSTLMLLVSSGCYSGMQAQDSLGASDAGSAGDAGDADGDDDGDDGASDDGAPPPENVEEVARIGLRRLTSAEYDATLRDILLDEESNSELLLPVDPRTPFDNDYTTQIPSETLIEATELLAADAADRLLEDPTRMASVLPCAPTGPEDEACLQAFAEQFGRRALRRPVTPEEIELLLHGDSGQNGAAEFAADEGDFGLSTLR